MANRRRRSFLWWWHVLVVMSAITWGTLTYFALVPPEQKPWFWPYTFPPETEETFWGPYSIPYTH